MSDRIYNRKLECGCLITSDAGGGVMPCCYPGYDNSTEEEIERCKLAWQQWEKTEDYKLYCKELRDKNED